VSTDHLHSGADGSASIDNLRTQLAACLPGLSDDDLDSLAVQTTHELEYRVGDALSKGLTDTQLAEFEQLVDRGEDEQCTRWLASTVPTYKATVAIVCSRLIAEVTESVASADPAAVIGSRCFAEMVTTSADLIEAHCRASEFRCTRTDDSVFVAFPATETRPAVGTLVDVLDGNLLTITGTAPEVSFPAASRDALNAFAAKWNLDTWVPKAVVAPGSEPDRCRLTGEMAIPLPRRVTRAHVDTLITDAVSGMFAFFDEVRKTFDVVRSGSIAE
jgi:hypothetical protein